MTPDTRALRLPGSVGEIVASPPGPRVGAFFDLDGTLVAGFTAAVHAQDSLRRRAFGVGEFLGLLGAAISHRLGGSDFEDLLRQACRGQRGRLLNALDELGERLFVQEIASRIYPEMRELVRTHLERGHTVVISSSAMTVQVEPVARFLGVDNVLSNRFETDGDGFLTGGVVDPILWGPSKARAVQHFAEERGVDLEHSYFYADGDEDLPLMHLVGHPRPTNPQGKLAAVAARRGWPVLTLASRGGGAIGQLRNLAGISSLLPVAVGAVGIGLLTRNKRRGVNFLTANWFPLVLAVNGVTLNVRGQHNLTARRPAVFIFNHRNNFDPFIIAALVHDNFTGVAKKELEKHPIIGTLGRLLDTAFIDRDDARSAVGSLHQIEEHAKMGLSVVVAPEGTRLDTTEVGPFKKGPFRIAMSAGIPIVPIVIRNAEAIAGRDSSTMNPGTVDVVVLPPITVDHWTIPELPDRIGEIRQLYLDTLKDWPGEQAEPDGERTRATSANSRSAASRQNRDGAKGLSVKKSSRGFGDRG